MENRGNHNTHVLAIPYPSQGHINPMLQFSRRLAFKGVKATLAITKFIFNTFNPTSHDQVSFTTISDGYDEGGFFEAESIDAYVARLEMVGSKSLAELIEKYSVTSNPITCVVYDSFLPWGLEVAKKYNLIGAAFFTQACAVDYIYYLVYHNKLTIPIASFPVDIPGLPLLYANDLPSFVGVPGPYPAYTKLVVNQNRNLNEADFVLVNTYYELEDEICVDIMGMVHQLCEDTVKVEFEPERLKKAQVDLEIANGKVEELKRRVAELESKKGRHLKEMELKKVRMSELETKLSAVEERNSQLHQRVEDGSKRVEKLKIQVQELEKRGSYADGETAGYRTYHRRLLTILPLLLPKVNWDDNLLKSLDEFMDWAATCERI